jgi:hypothetical protein
MEEVAMFSDFSSLSSCSYLQFADTYFMGTSRNYAFGSNMQLHSLVRALQYKGNRIVSRPSIRNGKKNDSDEEEFFTVSEFISSILARDSEMFKNTWKMMLPYSKMMDAVIKAERKMSECTEISARRHSKKRLITFRTRDMFSGALKEEILSYISGDKNQIGIRVLTVIGKFCEMMELDTTKFLDDPISMIRENLSFEISEKKIKTPFLTFNKILEEFLRIRLFYSSEMMLSSMDRGSGIDNLVSIWCERAFPNKMLGSYGKNNLQDVKENLCTWISCHKDPEELSDRIQNMIKDRKDECYNVGVGDTLVDRGLKLWILRDQLGSVNNTVVYFSKWKDVDQHQCFLHTDLRTLILTKIDRERTEISVEYMDNDPHNMTLYKSDMVWKMFSAEIATSHCPEYTRNYFTTNLFSSSEIKSDRRFKHKIRLTRGADSWNISILMSWDKTDNMHFSSRESRFINVMSHEYFIYPDIVEMMANNMEVENNFFSDFQSFNLGSMGVFSLQKFMDDNHLMDESKFILGTQGSLGNSDTYRVYQEDDVFREVPIEGMDEENRIYGMEMKLQSIMSLFSTTPLETFDISRIKEENIVSGGFKMSMLDSKILGMINKINDMDDEEVYMDDVPMMERKSMVKSITYAITNAVKSELKVDVKEMRNLLKSVMLYVDFGHVYGNIWDCWVSRLKYLYDMKGEPLKDWMLRLITFHIYSMAGRTERFPCPKILHKIEESEKYTTIGLKNVILMRTEAKTEVATFVSLMASKVNSDDERALSSQSQRPKSPMILDLKEFPPLEIQDPDPLNIRWSHFTGQGFLNNFRT